MTTEARIIGELELIKKELDYIKENMVDIDMVLTKKEEKILDESLEELKQGKTVSLKDFEKKCSK